jgi:transcriptional repressor NrdR
MSHLKIGESKVLESRESPDGTMIRRRRVSLDGKHRFTTYERIERPGMMVRKRSGAREAFDRDKLMRAVRNSVGKYFNSDLDVQHVVDLVEEKIYDVGKDEVPSSLIGETILDVLSDMNEMAYVRFASVFREFKTLDELEKSIAEQRAKMEARKQAKEKE